MSQCEKDTEKILFLGGTMHGKIRVVPFGAVSVSVPNIKKIQKQGCMSQGYYRTKIAIEGHSRDVMIKCGGMGNRVDYLLCLLSSPPPLGDLRKADFS